MHLSVPPNVKDHPVYLLAEGISTLFLNHMNELLLEENASLLVVEYPPEEPDLELFDKPLLVGQQLKESVNNLFAVDSRWPKYLFTQELVVHFLIIGQYLFYCVGKQVGNGFVAVEASVNDVGELIHEGKDLMEAVYFWFEILGYVFNDFLESEL